LRDLLSFSFDIRSNPVAIASIPPNGIRELTRYPKTERIDGRSGIMPGPAESPASCNCWLYDSRFLLYWSDPLVHAEQGKHQEQRKDHQEFSGW